MSEELTVIEDISPDDSSTEEKINENITDDEDEIPTIGTERDLKKNEVQFIVIKEMGTPIDYRCPNCKDMFKISLGRFIDDGIFLETACTECKTKILLNLDFTPKITVYVPAEN